MFTFLTTSVSIAYNLPDIGSSSNSSLSYKDERMLGEYIYSNIQSDLALVSSPIIEDYIQILGNKLLNNSNKHYESFNFFIVDSSDINAFALPGGFIGVNRGLITAAENESELAAVLAHEITHVNQRHIARSFEKQQQLQLPMIAGILAGALLSAYSPQAGQSIIAGSMAAGNQSLINYTRSNEEEADRIGMSVLTKSGYSPYSMGKFFNKLQRNAYSDKETYPEYLRTHPVTDNRITDANSRADEILINKANKNNNSLNIQSTNKDQKLLADLNSNNFNFALIKSLFLYSKNNNTKNLKYYSEAEQDIFQNDIEQFGNAYYLLKNNKFQEAGKIFKNLNAKYPKNSIIASLYAESYSKQPSIALNIIATQLKQNPTNIPLNLQYARIALNNNKPNAAITTLKKVIKYHNNYPLEVNLLLANSYNKLNQKWQASLAYSDYSVQKGDLSSAIMQLKSTSKYNKLNEYQTKITNYRIKSLEAQFKDRKEQLQGWI
ncbi:MAG: M48 family metallopeptidase [Gammaproteobacteria bacterium]|nr:M48 family metallopeptidase [Gammaproteobacteria bacterium]